MSSTFLIIHAGSDTVTNSEFLDINFSSVNFPSVPKVVASVAENVNVFISDLTIGSARINFSQKYSGLVRYTVVGKRI